MVTSWIFLFFLGFFYFFRGFFYFFGNFVDFFMFFEIFLIFLEFVDFLHFLVTSVVLFNIGPVTPNRINPIKKGFEKSKNKTRCVFRFIISTGASTGAPSAPPREEEWRHRARWSGGFLL